jgi:hypothetical protein
LRPPDFSLPHSRRPDISVSPVQSKIASIN